MKFLNINATINVKPQFDGEVLKAGTPLDISGAIANSDAAVGIVASDTAVGAESIAIVTEGTIDLTELTASYGSALTDECIAALKGITFLYGGKAVVPSGGGLPDYSEASDGDVLAIDNGAPAWTSGGNLPPLITLRADIVSADPIEFELTQDSQEAMLTEPDWRLKNPIVTLGLYSGNSLLKLVRLFWNGEIDVYMPGDAGAGEYQSLVTDFDSFGLLSVRLRRLEDGYAVRFTSLTSE